MASSAINSCTFNEYLRILELAFDYLSIELSEKDKIADIIKKKIAENSQIHLGEVLVQENLITDDQADQVAIFDEHLRTIGQDQRFGELVVANGMAAEQDVAKALEQQQSSFEKYRINLKLGDILVEDKIISNADRLSVLLTQNRIADEHLYETLENIGKTLAQKEAINKRFGALAIKKELVTIDQVNQALEIQAKERSQGGNARFVGQILQEIAALSQEDIQALLNEQRQFEKRRLDLEKALYNTKSEIKIAKRLNRLFEYRISSDGVEVTARRKSVSDEIVTIYEFLLWLKRTGIIFGILPDTEIEKVISDTEKKAQVVVARGIAAQPCADESIEFYFETGEVEPQEKGGNKETDTSSDPENEESETTELETSAVDSDAPETDTQESEETESEEAEENKDAEDDKDTEEDKEENSEPDGSDEEPVKPEESKESEPPAVEPVLVQKGALLARIIPGEPGRPGKDVMGRIIQPGRSSAKILNAGKGVVKKGMEFFAQTSGRPVLKNEQTLVVESVIKASGKKVLTTPVAYDTEELYLDEHIELTREILPEGVLRCYSLEITGHLKGSVVCVGEVTAKGEIGFEEKPGKDKDEEDKKPTIASVSCSGMVRASKKIINADIRTDGELMAYNSTIAGSQIIAAAGITAKDVVAGSLGPSCLRFGLPPKDKLHAIEHTIENKVQQLNALKQVDKVAELEQEFEKELAQEKQHELEQSVFKNLVEIIDAPELYQHDSLLDKIEYLRGLPDFSSVKACYLKLPVAGDGVVFLEALLKSVEKSSVQEALEQFKKKIDPEEEDEDKVDTGEYQAQIQFKAKMAALEKEIEAQAPEIEKIEHSITELENLRTRLMNTHVNDISRSGAVAKIKNKCEKGTVIKGKIASLVVEKSIYNVQFKEVLDIKNNRAFIMIDQY